MIIIITSKLGAALPVTSFGFALILEILFCLKLVRSLNLSKNPNFDSANGRWSSSGLQIWHLAILVYQKH